MARVGALKQARRLLQKKDYGGAISLLEPLVIDYRDSFEFFYLLGVSCLYSGDTGGAQSYFQRARQIKIRDVNLILSQAVLFLRRGNTKQAVEYYLEALELDPKNKIAAKALDFIRVQGEPDVITEWVAEGKIMRFYPPLGFDLLKRRLIVAAICICFLLTTGAVFFTVRSVRIIPERADLSAFVLTVEEQKSPVEKDSSGSYRYILTNAQVTASFENARRYFQEYRDNAALVEINRILGSNASTAIRRKTSQLLPYLEDATFDNLKDNYTYAQVAVDPLLYMDCSVIWSGRVTNVRSGTAVYECDFLVGYDTGTKIDGIVPLLFDPPVLIDPGQPLRVLAKIGNRDGRLFLNGKSVYQPIGSAQ